MGSTKTITISIPLAMGKEIIKVAKQEHRTVSELLREAFRQYQAQRKLQKLASLGKKTAKEKGLTSEDLGGPFEE